MSGRRRPAVLAQLMSGQQSLFAPAPPLPATLDEMCPPPRVEQIALDVDAAIRSASQTTIEDFTTVGSPKSPYAVTLLANDLVLVRSHASGLQGLYERSGVCRSGNLRCVPAEVITAAVARSQP